MKTLNINNNTITIESYNFDFLADSPENHEVKCNGKMIAEFATYREAKRVAINLSVSLGADMDKAFKTF